MASTKTTEPKISYKIQRNNLNKVRSLKWPETKYILYITFKGIDPFDLNAPMGFLLRRSTLNWLGLTRKRVEMMEIGSGFDMKGLRDYQFYGNADEIYDLIEGFRDSPFHIHTIRVEIATPEDFD